MRKKLRMRSGGKTAKFASGGRVSQGLRSTRASQNRVQEAERAMGPAPADMSMAYDLRPAVLAGADAGGVGASLPTPPEFQAPPPPIRRRVPARGREMSADELNDREMTRILNERSLAAAQAGRNMYACGGLVKPRKVKK